MKHVIIVMPFILSYVTTFKLGVQSPNQHATLIYTLAKSVATVI